MADSLQSCNLKLSVLEEEISQRHQQKVSVFKTHNQLQLSGPITRAGDHSSVYNTFSTIF